MQILTVFHYDDTPQLLLQAITIKKFWQDSKVWTLIIEDRNNSDLCLEACDKIKNYMKDWQINIILPESNFEASGWIRQQLFKMWYASKCSDAWVLIIDCKNFLIRPTNFNFFVSKNKVKKIPLFQTDDFTILTHESSKKFLGINETISLSSSITPCVWNTNEVRSLVSELGISLDNWIDGSATEFSLYYLWTYKKFKYIEKQFATGFWDQLEDKELANNIALQAMKNKKFIFWVHHRFVYDLELRKLTCDVLKNAGIKKESLELWNKRYEDMISLKESSIKQDRTLWKGLLD